MGISGGFIPNANADPFGSYSQFTGDYDYNSYLAQKNKGFDWVGNTWAKAAGAPGGVAGAAGTGAPAGATWNGANWVQGGGRGGGGGVQGPGSMSSGVTSLATGGAVGGPYKADAQLAQVNSQFADIMKRGLGQINEQAAIGGGFAGGIPFENRQKFITDTGNAQSAAVERIMNDILGRNQSWDLDQKRFELQKQLAMMGGSGGSAASKWGNSLGANDNQDLLSMYEKIQQQQGGGGGGDGGGGGIQPGDQYTSSYDNTARQGETGTPTERRAASSDFYKAYGHWPAPNELEDYMNGNMVNVSGASYTK